MEFQNVYFRTIAVLCFFLTCNLADGDPSEKELRAYFQNSIKYDKLVRPVMESSNVVAITVEFTPAILRDIDVERHLLTLDAWLTISWTDEYLQWVPGQYGDLKELRLPATEVWLPDLVIFSGTSEISQLPRNGNVVISNQGRVTWSPFFTAKNRCYNLRYTGLRANCTVSLLSWTYDSTQLDIHVKNETSLDYLERGFPGWYVETVTSERIEKHFSCCEKPHTIMIDFTVTLRRRVFGVWS